MPHSFAISAKELAGLIKPMLEKGLSCRFVSGGTSMKPFIMDQDCITIEPIKGRKPEVGDIVAYEDPLTASVVIHRIIKKEKKNYLIKGDNCKAPDGFINIKYLYGICTKIERKGRNIRIGIGFEKKIISRLSCHPFPMKLIRCTIQAMDTIASRL